MENRQCKQCEAEFIVEDEDLKFYKDISPTFGDKTFAWPAPTLCPTCRDIKRCGFRNERSLYKRKCDKTGQDMVSIYSPDKTDYKVYKISEWYKDDWDATEYGRDFDFAKSFFDQFDKLLHDVPRLSLYNTKTENCDYANYVAECKNCYMSMICYYNSEECHYCYRVYTSKDNIDLNYCIDVEKCYECTYCNHCHNCQYSSRLNNCHDCFFSTNLIGCKDCMFSSNLNQKQYYIENKPYSKEEYEKEKAKYDLGSYEKVQKYLKMMEKNVVNFPLKYANQVKCEDCIGENLLECKNCKYCFDGMALEDCKYCLGEKAKNVYDSRGGTYEWAVECNHTGFGSNFIACSGVLGGNFMYYCENCHESRDCFGCAGLRNKQYCVFNKQYSKEEYEALVPKIIDHMIEKKEWGEFFPLSTSFFGYNESLANTIYPRSKEEALAMDAKWQEKTFDSEYSGEYYEPSDNISHYIDNEEEQKKLLKGVIKCEESGRLFKIMPQELLFYINNSIPIPRKHYDIRYNSRIGIELCRVFHHRQCMCEETGHDHSGKCTNEFETPYAPDRPEKIYCESCYQKSVI